MLVFKSAVGRPRSALSALGVIALCMACGGRDTTSVFYVTVPEQIPSSAEAEPSGVTSPLTPDEAELPEPDAGVGATRGECGFVGVPAYSFPSGSEAGESSVSYGGASLRHVLLSELSQFIEGLSTRTGAPYRMGELVAALDVFLRNPDGRLDVEPLSPALVGSPALTERSHAELAAGASLIDELAGNAGVSGGKVWTDPGVFRGWSDASIGRADTPSFTPEGLLVAFCEEIENSEINRGIGFLQRDPARNLLPVTVTGNGRDFGQLIRSFLIGAVSFSEATGRELSSEMAGVGLLASPERSAELAHSALEHAWDEAFGHFGAARDYDRYTADEVAAAGGGERGNGWYDSNADCSVSLSSEVNFGASVYAAERDRSSVVATDLRGDVFRALVQGRQLISEAGGALSLEDQAELAGFRDQAVAGWEKVLSATVVHGLNSLRTDVELALASSANYAFRDQARHWSELKGLALAFQFNPRSVLSPEAFDSLHALIRDAPVIPDTLPPTNVQALQSYLVDLQRARDLLAEAHAFHPDNVATW